MTVRHVHSTIDLQPHTHAQSSSCFTFSRYTPGSSARSDAIAFSMCWRPSPVTVSRNEISTV